MGLTEDFATWSEKTRRKLLRECGDSGRTTHDKLPPGVPVSLPESLDFLDVLEQSDVPSDVRERAGKWRDKLCRTPTFKRDHSFRD